MAQIQNSPLSLHQVVQAEHADATGPYKAFSQEALNQAASTVDGVEELIVPQKHNGLQNTRLLLDFEPSDIIGTHNSNETLSDDDESPNYAQHNETDPPSIEITFENGDFMRVLETNDDKLLLTLTENEGSDGGSVRTLVRLSDHQKSEGRGLICDSDSDSEDSQSSIGSSTDSQYPRSASMSLFTHLRKGKHRPAQAETITLRRRQASNSRRYTSICSIQPVEDRISPNYLTLACDKSLASAMRSSSSSPSRLAKRSTATPLRSES